ncbi:MAG TPA: hypothetical protein VF230_05705 [Acidimicrobiales bacterium]
MIRYKPKVSLVGLVSGVLVGASLLALAHQNGSLYPTRNLAIAAVVAGALLCGILFPSLVRLRAVGKANRRIAVARSRR